VTAKDTSGYDESFNKGTKVCN